MARSPLPRVPGMPGTPILGFVACGAIVRRSAFLEVGGCHARIGTGGEEELLALDLAAAGWQLAYLPEVVAHHHPARVGDRGNRTRRLARNSLWVSWLRRPAPVAARATARALREPRALGDAARGLAWIARERRVVPGSTERQARLLETSDRRRTGA
jgi:N-acetylglucosaminyl-diphospho-decaprenol L-rhamnosyltransferase